jgi:hypothetical protein
LLTVTPENNPKRQNHENVGFFGPRPGRYKRRFHGGFTSVARSASLVLEEWFSVFIFMVACYFKAATPTRMRY